MGNFFHAILYEPILKLLIWIYETIAFNSFGLAVIFLTIGIQIILFPLFWKSAKHQAVMQKLQPKVKHIQESLKHDKEKQATELLSLYKEHKINPFGSVLLLFVQLPIIIALYQVLLKEISSGLFDNFIFLGLIDLRQKSLILTLIATLLQYIQGRLSLPKTQEAKGANPMADMGKMMLYMGPIITLVILQSLPAALGVYWITSTIFTIGRQIIINKKMKEKELKVQTS
ncbi:hypothetical protein A3A21_02505 [Candidatus Jorgensenbacteria bacterium RIFCSPLOWO2_01_FULL_45_25b]|uniref:Membrane insertase YidC/Oxa/ALB C-terminal domain-containing protein n=1 Tax=Candidatus Jorgensenbacteria bacterium RIFCSPLOWO2_01_FULL_45_25b TaxID=1798471 RepID=A0A1F6BTW5_9BACT|nr:MAG: hypothetical protein A3A21_02505 [Candidatus Jorgensenbacteria bacterium RIFCSPLOWO2_01_FULL_45_25b]